MNKYLLAEANREAISTHNEELLVTTTKQVGKASYVSHDFNSDEEFRQLDDAVAAEGIGELTVRMIALRIYGTDDDMIVRRVRSNLTFGSRYQRTLRNGFGVIARQDGSLRITRTADEYGTLVTENLAADADRLKKGVAMKVKRIDRQAAAAVDKVPELAAQMAELRKDMKTSLTPVFTRQLELLSGD